MSHAKELAISQLRSLPAESHGVIVPCDAEVYWDKLTEIETLEDLNFVKVNGGGGTVLVDFFRDYPARLGDDFDIIYVLTDGFIDIEDIVNYKPERAEVHWIICENKEFSEPFGKAFHVDMSVENR